MTAPQLGHLPRFPAPLAGVATVFPQCEHGNSMRFAGAAAPGFRDEAVLVARLAAVGGVCGTAGIWTTTPQFGHIPFLPAVASPVRTGN